ncbi:phosphoenolpyruvate carboxykinase (ATP) [Marchantia polymorpha subsp. ruderalis]
MSSDGVSNGLPGLNGLSRIATSANGAGKSHREVCADDSVPTVQAQNVEELHSRQMKKSAPSTPRAGLTPKAGSTPKSDDDRQREQLESISTSLASLTRESGPQVVRGDPTRNKATKQEPVKGKAANEPSARVSDITDSALKFTHVLYNLSPAELYEQALKSEKGSYITSTGALATLSGAKTGRSPKDKRVVLEESSQDDLWWGKGSPNIEMDSETFLINRERAVDYLNSLEKVFVNDQFLNWDPENRIKVRIISARAYHSLFMYNMCIRPTPEELEDFGTPDFTIYNAGQFPCNRRTHYMSSSTSVDVNLKRREMVILGTQYAGEMKKGLFSLMHYLMPKRGILSLHSGCNMGKQGDVALFFGLSGTGKTTLSTDHNRYLIGDDEHCWSDNGVSNIEGGCYAKCIDLSQKGEPDIWNAIKFGTVVENVVFDEHTREVDYADKSVTENTRAAYPIEFIPNAKIPCVGPHPKNIILLACDAFGVLPPVSKLTLAQTMYHFISGYTAVVAGTEDGVKEPTATFSACYGAAFIMMHPTKYASMLAEKMQKHGATAWLVNTGWSGGGYGVGSRMRLAYTRSIIDAIHDGSLLDAEYVDTPIFNLHVPKAVAGVPTEILQPQNSWKDKDAYNASLKKLAGLFQKNFKNFSDYEVGGDSNLTHEILAAGPIIE